MAIFYAPKKCGISRACIMGRQAGTQRPSGMSVHYLHSWLIDIVVYILQS
jgi:hypothetical protein